MLRYIYKIKIVLRSPVAIFWTLMFPIFLGMLFYFMFGNIDVEQQFSKIPVGVYVESEDANFIQMMEDVKTEDDEPMFDIHEYNSVDEADKALKNDDIDGYIIVREKDASESDSAEKNNDEEDLTGGMGMIGGMNLNEMSKEDITSWITANKDIINDYVRNSDLEGAEEFDFDKDMDANVVAGQVQSMMNNSSSDYELVVKDMDIGASVIKTFLDQYIQANAMMTKTINDDPGKIMNVISGLYGNSVEIKDIPLEGEDKSPYTQYFFALIAMTCLIASQFGLENGKSIQADQSAVGARRNVAPTPKLSQVVSDFLATFTIFSAMLLIVLFVVVFVYKQDFGSNAGLIVLNALVGGFTGEAAGTMIAVMVKGDAKKKDSICVLFFMGSSFLGGLMWGDITYYLEKNLPIINRINPATLIVNGFRSIAVFGNYEQYFTNLATLFGIGVVFILISAAKLRRQKYASI